MDDVSEGVGPGFANSGLIFLHRFLNPVGLSDSCILAKTCDTANKAGPNQVDKRLGSFGSQIVEHKNRVLIDRIAFIPVQSSQVKQISIQGGLPQLPRMLQPALVYSGIMLKMASSLTETPEPSLIPEYSSRKCLGVKGLVMIWFA